MFALKNDAYSYAFVSITLKMVRPVYLVLAKIGKTVRSPNTFQYFYTLYSEKNHFTTDISKNEQKTTVKTAVFI